MRPSRLVVGEVRTEECLDLLVALNAGLPGMASLHANSAREALMKMARCRCWPARTSGSCSGPSSLALLDGKGGGVDALSGEVVQNGSFIQGLVPRGTNHQCVAVADCHHCGREGAA